MNIEGKQNRNIKNYILATILVILQIAIIGGAPFAYDLPYPWDLIIAVVFTLLAIVGLLLYFNIWKANKRKNKNVKLHWTDYLYIGMLVLFLVIGLVFLILYFIA